MCAFVKPVTLARLWESLNRLFLQPFTLPIPPFCEHFEHVLVDCVGLLLQTKSGNQFLLIIMCISTQFHEAIPLRKITASGITKALRKLFTTVKLLNVVQIDQGTNFLFRTFKQTLQSMGVGRLVSDSKVHVANILL